MSINFDFGDLEAFLAVSEKGSFQLAAEKLNISQSAVTRRIQKLESSLKVKLFVRTTRSLKLTQEAKSFRARAQTMLDSASEAILALRDESSQFEFQRNAIITIAAIPTSIHDILPKAIKVFHQQGYQARINVLDHFANDVAESVSQGEADFGISFMGTKEPSLEFENILEDHFVLAVHQDHPLNQRTKLHWKDLRGLPVIAPWKGTGNRLLIDNELAKTQQSLEWLYQAHHSSTSLGFVEASIAVAVLPESAIPKRQDSVIISKPLTEPVITRTIGTVRKTNHSMSPMAKQFYRILVDIFNQKPKKNQ